MTVNTNAWALEMWEEYFGEDYSGIDDVETLRDNWFDFCDQEGRVFDMPTSLDALDAMTYPFRTPDE